MTSVMYTLLYGILRVQYNNEIIVNRYDVDLVFRRAGVPTWFFRLEHLDLSGLTRNYK